MAEDKHSALEPLGRLFLEEEPKGGGEPGPGEKSSSQASKQEPPTKEPSNETTPPERQPQERKGLKREHYFYILFLAVLLAGSFLRFNFVLPPMNDEILYTAASMETYYDFAPDKEINAEHPPVSKFFLSLACQAVNCNPPILLFWYGLKYPLSVPFPEVFVAVLPIMEAMRAVPFIFSLLLGLVVYYYAKKQYGKEPALVLFAVTMLSPNFILYSNAVMLDMITLFFFTLAFFFYLFTYRTNRTLQNLAVLTVLLTLSFGTKQYVPLTLLPIIAATEAFEYRKGKPIDKNLLAGLALSLIIFLAVVYPFPKFAHHFFNFYAPGTDLFGLSFNFGLLLTLLARIELPLLVLLALSGYYAVAVKKRPLASEEAYLLLAALIIALVSIKIPVEKSAFRYALVFYPPLVLFCGFGLENMEKKFKGWVAALLVLSALLVILNYPYYDDLDGPLGLAIPHSAVERTEYFGVLSFLSENYADKLVLTTDYYSLPYSRGLQIGNINGYFYYNDLQNETNVVFANVDGTVVAAPLRSAFRLSFCRDVQTALSYLSGDGVKALVYRKNNDASFVPCESIDDFSRSSKPEYEDANFKVFKIS